MAPVGYGVLVMIAGVMVVAVLVGAAGEVEASSVEVAIVGVALAGVTPVTVGWVVVATGVDPGDGTQATIGDAIKIKKRKNTTRRMVFAFRNWACFNH